MLDGWLQDVNYAARLLRRNPLFTLTAALSLAVGIGANTTIFTIANALLFKAPAEVSEPSRLVDIGRSQNGQGFDNGSYSNFLDIRARNRVFTDVYAHRLEPQPMSLGGADGAERIYGNLVTSNYFTTLGTRAHLGRLFSSIDSEQAGAAPVAVLSHRFWTRRYQQDSSLVGRTITLNGHPFTVIGVAREGFQGTTIFGADLWVPMNMAPQAMPRGANLLTSRASVWLVMGARLRPGVTVQQAQADLATVAAALEREFPEDNRGQGLRVAAASPVPGNATPVATFLALLMAVVGLVLVIACINVAGVLLARATARRREIAVRLAIGAGRARLVRHLLVETSLLFLVGAAAGVALARVMTSLLVALLPTLPVQIAVSLALDMRAVAFTVGLSLIAAIGSGLAPAFHATKADVIAGLKSDAGGGPARMRLRNAFVVAQAALSVVLVVGAALFARSLQRAASIDPGFDPRGVELAALDLSLGGYTETTGPAFAGDLIGRVRAIPDVEDAALAAVLPLGLNGLGLGGLRLPGETRDGGPPLEADWNVVSPHYFAAMKTPLIAGRDFDDRDRAGSPWVVIVNETAARRWWPDGNAVGKPIVQQTGRPGRPDAERPLTVIGIARDTKYRSLGDPPRAFVYAPLGQQYLPRTTIVARSTRGRRLAAELRAVIASANPNLPIVTSQTLEDYTAIGLVPQRVAASVSGSLGFVGLFLAAIGIYGVTAYVVTSRTREIGIRMALGAGAGDVVRLVLRQGMTLALAGVAIGLSLAAVASRALGSLLFGVGPTDAIAFGGSAVLFCLVALAACYVPSRRAVAVQATDALRHE